MRRRSRRDVHDNTVPTFDDPRRISIDDKAVPPSVCIEYSSASCVCVVSDRVLHCTAAAHITRLFESFVICSIIVSSSVERCALLVTSCNNLIIFIHHNIR